MKKLIIMAVVAASAVALQAGTIKWGSTTGAALYNGTSTTTLTSANTLYLFDANTYTRDALFQAFANDGAFDTAKALASVALGDDGKFAVQSYDATKGQSYALYLAVVDGDNVFISNSMTQAGPDDGKTVTKNFTVSAASKNAATEITLPATLPTTAGWYTASVPEPTSGLLLLLGMAGLALRRKHA